MEIIEVHKFEAFKKLFFSRKQRIDKSCSIHSDTIFEIKNIILRHS